MTNPHLAEQLVAARERETRVRSERARLVALARCCRPSEIATRLVALLERIPTPWAHRRTPAGCA
jgi:hypothetical protein